MSDNSIGSQTAELDKVNARKVTMTLWLVATGFFMQTLDTTIVNTALPSIARSLGEAPLHMQSVVIAYSLTMALVIPASGFLADRFGTRRVFLAAIVIFTVGSLMCANSRALWQLVSARVVQGVGGAMLLPVGRLAILRNFPRERYLPALSSLAILGLVGPLLGPTLGGWLTDVASWHWIFLINVPIGAVGCVGCFFFMVGKPQPTVTRFDFKGYILLALAMLSLTIALDGLAELGLQRASVLVLLILAFAFLVSYALHSTDNPESLLPLTLLKIPTFKIGLLGNLFARIGGGAMPYLLPLLLQVALGYTPFHAGLMMLPVAAAGIASKRVIVAMITAYGYRTVLVSNTVLAGLSMASFAFVDLQQPLWIRLLQLAFFGAVNSNQFTAMNALTLKDLDTVGASSGNSLFSLTQMLSMSLGVTVAGAMLAMFGNVFSKHVQPQALPVFHSTFVCVGLITMSSAFIFAQLASDTRGIDARKTPPASE
jgi:EmrB/QacA subfamily drug resistance transporter